MDKISKQKLKMLRYAIDKADESLLLLLRQRFDVVQQIGQLKALLNLPAAQPERIKKMNAQRLKWAEKNKLNKIFVKKLFYDIHAESISIQKKERGKK